MTFKRFMLFGLVLTLLLGMMGSVQAQDDPAELTALAAYVPETAPFFAAIRADDNYLDTLDALIADVALRLPPGSMPSVSVRALLNDIVTSTALTPETTFDSAIRPWLGDSVVLFLPSVDSLLFGTSEFPFVIGMAVSDLAAADAFVSEGLGAAYTRQERDGGTIGFEPAIRWDPSLILTGDALFIGLDLSSLILAGDGRTLANTPRFTSVLDALPGDAYNILVYIDLATPLQTLAPLLPAMLGPEMPAVDVTALVGLIGQQMLGFTIVDGRAVVMDLAFTGGAWDTNDPIDLSLLEYVPSDAGLLIQGSDLGSMVDQLLSVLNTVDALLRDSGALPVDVDGFTLDIGPADLATFFRLSVEGTTRLEFDEVIDALNGDFVSYLRLETADDGEALMPLNGLVLRSEAPETLEVLMDVMARQAQNMLTTASYEDGVLTVPLGTLFSLPEAGSMSTGIRDGVLVRGRTAEIDTLLERTSDNVTTTLGYAFEQSLFLPDASMLWYIDVAPLRAAILAQLTANPGIMAKEEQVMLVAVMDLISTSSITAAQSGDGAALRFTLTLSD